MILNDAGKMIQSVCDELPQHYPGADIDTFVVMPNHIHGIIFLNVGAGPRACPESGSYANPTNGQPQGVAPTISLPDIVHHFKTLTTTRYRHGVTNNNWASFPGKFWQRNYYEHIIRNEKELDEIREYIVNNPLQWALDKENPDLIGIKGQV